MTTPYQLFAAGIIVESGTTLPWSGVLADGVGTVTLDSSDAAHPTLPAGTYDPWAFCEQVATVLRQSIFDRLTADAAITVPPSAVEDIAVTMGLSDAGPVAGIGATLLSLRLGSALGDAETTNGRVEWQSFDIINTGNQWAPTGLARAGETRSTNATAAIVTVDGRYQPRWLLVTRSAFDDSGDYTVYPGSQHEMMGDGSPFAYRFGVKEIHRDFRFALHAPTIVGPEVEVGRFASFGATRNLLQLKTRDTNLLRNLTSATYKTLTHLATPQYLRCGRWWARYRQESPTDTLEMLDVWPTGVDPAAGEPIVIVPEAIAWMYEVERVGLCFRFTPKDSDGTTTYLPHAYQPRVSGAWTMRPERRAGSIYYSLQVPLRQIPNPGLTEP